MRQIISRRTAILVVVHLVLLSLSYEIAYQLRFDQQVPESERALFWRTLPWILILKLVMFHRFGSFHGWWRYVTFTDLAALLQASFVSAALIGIGDYLFFPQFQISHAIIAIDWGVTVLLVGGLRSTWRIAREHVWPKFAGDNRRPTLMVGAYQQGDALARQIHNNPRLSYRIVGFLDDDLSRRGSVLGGIPFLDSPARAVEIAKQKGVRDILVHSQCVSGLVLRKLMDECRLAGIQLKVIPSLDELINGDYRMAIRDVDINDLLRRKPIHLDEDVISTMLSGRRVMVTGAGGSIGSEICRQIVRQRPETLILVERFENNLFIIERELIAMGVEARIIPCIADIGDEERMEAIFAKHAPQIVFHAAAHKHVPLMEHNPGEAIKNNVQGTITLVDLAERHEVERFVMISTDKAVNPTSIMGVSKQLAERYVHACSEDSNTTKFVAVRFGNVLASAGSVVPIFQDQIRRGGPITVTHEDMRRYFMTIPEASQLVLQAASMGKGGEIYVLDMGEPVKIIDLARDLIRLSGLSPHDIEIKITGVRPGEKLYEELYMEEEQMLTTPHPKLKVAYHRSHTRQEVLDSVDELMHYVHDGDDEMIREKLKQIAPEYCPPPVATQPETKAVEPAAEQLAMERT